MDRIVLGRTMVMLTVFVLTLVRGAPASPPRSDSTPRRADVPLCVTTAPAAAQSGQILVGYATGRLRQVRIGTGSERVTSETLLDGAVVSVLSSSTDGAPAAVAGTAKGRVAGFDRDWSRPGWEFSCTCEVSSLARMPDCTADGVDEVLVGGADHRVHLLDGRTGKRVWSHLFESPPGDAYVIKALAVPDQDRDGTDEVAVWMWSGELAVLGGRTGESVWRKRVSTGFSDAVTCCPDLDGDGIDEILVGGNDGTVRACSQRDGHEVWTGRLSRTVRDIAVTETGQSVVAWACTAAGQVACFQPRISGTERKWVTDLGDVCRALCVAGDIDLDRTTDVAVCTEEGCVALLSGATGRTLRRQHASDVVRAICPAPSQSGPVIVTASLAPALSLLRLDSPHSEQAASKPQSPAFVEQPRVRTPAGPASASADPRVIILLYHDVLPEIFYHYGCAVDTFRSHMDMLETERYACVSLDDIADWVEGKRMLPERAVCITFDGPYQGHHTWAYPILRERGFFATSYITTDWIGSANHADWHQLREMEEARVMEIQNHSANHPMLTRCGRAEVYSQLRLCNEAIARRMAGKVARHHAYPSGAENSEVRRILRELGFRTATTIVGRAVTREDDLMALPRYTVCTHTTPQRFRAWLTGEAGSTADR